MKKRLKIYEVKPVQDRTRDPQIASQAFNLLKSSFTQATSIIICVWILGPQSNMIIFPDVSYA